MKMRTLRRLAQQAPRTARRRLDLANVTIEPDPGPAPEEVFDRITGPYGNRGTIWQGDEET
ncbi:MAG: hypothetical protein KF773_07445 [Deltaproteobacteria bacterium]|nr:hypothetical protein [Deltaproteobacteria bacterium]MCW5808909.1 hypothetical protein [Deltaproteobacteria bacterium]